MPRPMKDSGVEWLGEIPAHWDVLNLGAVTETMRNGYVGPTKDLFVDDGIKYIQSLHIKDGRINFSRHEYYVSETWANIHPKIKKNDVLIVQTGDIGNVGLVTDEYDNCNCHALIIATPRTDLIFPNYLTYYLRSAVGRELLLFYKTGALLPHLNSGKIKFANICVPPLDEQQRIATFLDGECARIDSVIEKTRASIVEYKKLKQAIITRAVTKGIRPARTMKDSGVEWLGDIPADWDCTFLKRHCNFQTGSTPSTKNEQWFNGNLDWFTPADFNESYYLENSMRKLSLLAKEDEVATIIPKNTVMIIGIGGTAGKVGFNVKECSCNQQITAIKADDKLYPKFLMYWMISNTTRLKDTALFTTLPIINNQTIGQYNLLVPPMEEQKEIAQYLDEKTAAIDLLVEKKNQLATELERLKKSLIFEYVTGKKELTGGDLV